MEGLAKSIWSRYPGDALILKSSGEILRYSSMSATDKSKEINGIEGVLVLKIQQLIPIILTVHPIH